MTQVEIASEPPRVGWDLHCHTVFSDGTETPTTLVRDAKRIGLHGVAITDHDTTAGWQEAAQASHDYDEPLVRGTEITAHDEGISVHMLAYQYDPRNRHMCDLFAWMKQTRLERAHKMVDLLAHNYPITWEDVQAQVKEGKRTTVGRPHIADALVAAGVYPTRSDAFVGAVSAHSPYYIPTPSPTAAQVIQAVNGAGGVSVLAHGADPSRNRVVLSDEQIAALAHEGLDGLEVWHRGNSLPARERLLRLARQYQLLVTGGSDWHGAGKPNELGEWLTDDATVQEIVRRGAIPLCS